MKMELLAPAGSMEKLKAAILFGADAVYLSGKEFGLRAFSDNFTLEEMKEAVEFAHGRQVKVYVTVNIYARNKDLVNLPEYLRRLQETGADAIVISDPGIVWMAKEIIPDMPIHLSTQANTTNWAAAKFWKEQGIQRIVLARELSWPEIQEIHERNDGMEIEAFVHGALCMSYSGRCLLSNYMTGRDANQGACAQACRWNYSLMEQKRPGEYFPVFEDERGSYIFNSKDICLLAQIPLLFKAGICSLKVEGRMKSAHYVATIIKVYREALDAFERDPDNWQVEEHWLREIGRVSHREYTTGFFLGDDFQDAKVNLNSNENERSHDFVGLVLGYDPSEKRLLIEQRNHFKKGELLEFVPPQGANFTAIAADLRNSQGESAAAAPHPQEHVSIYSETPAPTWTLVRRA